MWRIRWVFLPAERIGAGDTVMDGSDRSMVTRLAVYGTLRLGQPNWGRLLWASRHLGTHDLDGFRLYDGGAFPYAVPFMGSRIVVDLFAVDEQTLKHCDWLEGHPDHYQRRRVAVAGQDAWLYCVDEAPGLPVIVHGDWLLHGGWHTLACSRWSNGG